MTEEFFLVIEELERTGKNENKTPGKPEALRKEATKKTKGYGLLLEEY